MPIKLLRISVSLMPAAQCLFFQKAGKHINRHRISCFDGFYCSNQHIKMRGIIDAAF